MFSLLVISFPELDRADVGGDEDGTAQEGVEGSGEDCRHYSLDKQHGRVCRGLGQGSLEKIFTFHRIYSLCIKNYLNKIPFI